MSVICQNFVQNAWRKDLCSNCFKSESDHTDTGCRRNMDRSTGRYIPQATTLYQSRAISANIHWRPLLADPNLKLQERISSRDFGSQTSLPDERAIRGRISGNDTGKGILKNSTPNRKPRRRSSVGFSPEGPLVIGYGGRDYDSDESPWELGSDDGSINLELLDSTEEDRSITKLTKNNTEFNSFNDNLRPNSSSPVNYSSYTSSEIECKRNAINNSKNNLVEKNNTNIFKFDNTKNKSTANLDKKLNCYYFSTQNDGLKSPTAIHDSKSDSLPGNITLVDHCKEMSIITKDIPSIIHNIENNNHEVLRKVNNINENDIQNLSNGNTGKTIATDYKLGENEKYLLITKISDASETNSDSDYSTSRQNNGESSTDNESFHDSEDRVIIPCSSFLHGRAKGSTDEQHEKKNFVAKPFETSSVSSTDMSTFSDDSDCQKVHEDICSDTKNQKNQRNLISRSTHKQETESEIEKAKFKYTSNTNMDSSKTITSEITSREMPTGSCTYKSVPVYLHKKSPPTSARKEVNNLTVDDNKTGKLTNNTESVQPNTSSEPNAIEIEVSDKDTSKKHRKSANGESEVSRSCDTFPNNERTIYSKSSTKSENHIAKTAKKPVVDKKSASTQELIDDANTGNSKTVCTENDSEHYTARNNCINPTRTIGQKTEETPFVNSSNLTGRPSASRQKSSYSDIYERSDNLNSTNSVPSKESKNKPPVPLTTQPISHESDAAMDQQEARMKQDGEPTDSNSSSTRNSPSSKLNRQSKLQALALELEKARCDSSSASSAEFKSPEIPDSIIQYGNPTPKLIRQKSSVLESTPTSQASSNKYPSIRRGQSLASAALNLNSASLPDILPEPTTKTKKSRFSLKKLLKRGKDSETLVINNTNDYNPKAWKHQIFDRSRLSLEIVHPMDFTSDSPASTDNTPTEDKKHSSVLIDPSGRRHMRHVTTRARSLSALPQLISITDTDGIQRNELSNGSAASLERPRIDMTRKAGTVAERSKKYKAPRRTPSFSELRSSSSTSGNSTTSGVSSERPQKPPPPPRGKSLAPPQPPSVPAPVYIKSDKNPLPLPTRPPPAKIPEAKENYLVSESLNSPAVVNLREIHQCDYANLGDIRQNITPKKPQRPSAVTFARETLQMETEHTRQSSEDTYESVEVQEEEDHYTYLDELEIKNGGNHKINGICERSSRKLVDELKSAVGGEKPPPQRPDETQHLCSARPAIVLKKPWMDLQASYAAIAAANYESLAELITTAISEGLENLQKSAASLKWNDFSLECDDPVQILEDKIVYNACYKDEPKTKVTLMVTTQKQHNVQPGRNPTRPPVLATFGDYLPRQYLSTGNKHYNYTDVTKAVVYVLQRSKTTTVSQFAQDSACFQTNQHIHLRNACFVLLQLIHTLKSLQAEGIEEIDYDLGHILLLHTDVDKPPILVLLPGDKVYLTMSDFYKADVATRKTTLCQTTLQLLFHLLQIHDVNDLSTCIVNGELLAAPVAHTFSVISKILSEEKASSLTQAKGLLEYMLWGPVDIKPSGNKEDIDVILQRWLDLQRAQMVKSMVSNLHSKISAHTGFHIYEEYQLIFLLQATVKTMKDIISKL